MIDLDGTSHVPFDAMLATWLSFVLRVHLSWSASLGLGSGVAVWPDPSLESKVAELDANKIFPVVETCSTDQRERVAGPQWQQLAVREAMIDYSRYDVSRFFHGISY